MKKLFVLFMLFIPAALYSQENVSVRAADADVINVTLSVEYYWSSGAGMYKNYLIIESSEAIGVEFRVNFRFDWDGQIETSYDYLSAGKTRSKSPLLESIDDSIYLLEVLSFTPSQYNGKPIVVTIN